MKRIGSIFPFLVFSILITLNIQADPRWWWDDALVAPSTGAIADVIRVLFGARPVGVTSPDAAVVVCRAGAVRYRAVAGVVRICRLHASPGFSSAATGPASARVVRFGLITRAGFTLGDRHVLIVIVRVTRIGRALVVIVTTNQLSDAGSSRADVVLSTGVAIIAAVRIGCIDACPRLARIVCAAITVVTVHCFTDTHPGLTDIIYRTDVAVIAGRRVWCVDTTGRPAAVVSTRITIITVELAGPDADAALAHIIRRAHITVVTVIRIVCALADAVVTDLVGADIAVIFAHHRSARCTRTVGADIIQRTPVAVIT